MRRSLGRLRRRIFGIAAEEASFDRRGFRGGDEPTRARLELIGRTFLLGYHAALEEDRPEALAVCLDGVEPFLRGFAHEGAGMGLAMLDRLAPWNRSRLHQFLARSGDAHTYMVHVGAGWAAAQLRVKTDRLRARLDPLMGWLAVDGYGFHHGYFRWPEFVDERRVPRHLDGYARRVFDQGLGRSLWFVEGAEVHRIAATIGRFPASRHADLWSGVGLACAYAGGVEAGTITELGGLAGPFRPHVAQGMAFAAKARERAGNPAPHTELACRIVCGLSAPDAAGLTDDALEGLTERDGLPAYEVWRGRIRAHWTAEVAAT